MSIPAAYVMRIYKLFRGEVLVLPGRVVVVLFCLILLVLPAITSHPLHFAY